MPLNVKIGQWDFPIGIALITLVPVPDRVCEPLHQNRKRPRQSIVFSALFVRGVHDFGEDVARQREPAQRPTLIASNVAARSELTPEIVGARPGNILVPVSNYNALYHLAAVLDRVKTERKDIVVLHVRLLRRAASGQTDFEADQLFGSIEQYLFTKSLALAEQRGKPIRLAVVAANDMWDGILRAGVSLESSTIVLGRSSKMSVDEQARDFGMAWEKLPDPRPQFNLEIFAPGGQREFFLLGPHAPNLTMNEVNLVHQLWLHLAELVRTEELHHHDVVHFALKEMQETLKNGHEQEVADRLREHLKENKTKRTERPS